MSEPKREFKYERQAMKNEPMPDGLKQHEQMAYLALRNIYNAYYAEKLSKEQAGEEKRKVLAEYDNAKKQYELEMKSYKYRARQTLMTANLVSEFNKNPSIETAQKLCNVLDGIERAMDSGVET